METAMIVGITLASVALVFAAMWVVWRVLVRSVSDALADREDGW